LPVGLTFGPWFGVYIAGYLLWAVGSPVAVLALLAYAFRPSRAGSRRVTSAVTALIIFLLWLPVLLPWLRSQELGREWAQVWAAAQKHDDATVAALLKRCPLLTNDKISLMTCGVQTGSVVAVTWALDHGADVNAPIPERGWTPLLQSLQTPAIAHLLLERGADPDRGSVDWTPLSKAVHQGNAALVEDLLAHHAGVDLLARFEDDNPLHVAARDGNRAMCELLLRSRADPFVPNRKHLTAAELAKNSDLAAWLRQQRPKK
jgi:hypothetical protein